MTVGRLIESGVGALVVAALGWVLTTVVSGFTAQPNTVENLTAAWTAAGPTPLDESTTVEVPPNRTLVAFLVGTDLVSIAGTATGNCAATSGGQPLKLSWPARINPELDATLRTGQQVVAVAGWTNAGTDPVVVEITCGSADSTVEHFVAVPTRTGALPDAPWFQPWGWVALGAAGVAAIAIGVARSTG